MKAKNNEKKQVDTKPVAAAPAKQQPKLDKKAQEIRDRKWKMAEKYKEEVMKKYSNIVKAVVLFGSLTRGDFSEKSDIDMLVIVDDVMARMTPEMKDALDDKLHEIAKGISEEITVQPAWTLSEFWDMARIGHPLLYTIVRDGWALYDTGFFIPIRKLLELGKIPATLEAVEKFMETAPQKINRVETAKLYMVAEDLYYAMLNSSQAVLMYLGYNPPSPKHTPVDVKDYLVNEKLLEAEYLHDLEYVIDFRKKVEHKEIKDITGQHLDELIDKAKKYVTRMEQLLQHLQKKKKESIVEKNYEVMIKAAVAALKKMEKLPPDPKDLPAAIRANLIDAKHVDPYFEETFKRVITMRKMLDDDKVHEIPQKDIELTREYVRRFVEDLRPIIEKPDAKKTQTKQKPAPKGKKK